MCGRYAVGYAPIMSETPSRPSRSAAPTEAESLLSVLERNRRTFAWETSGLDQKGLRATTAASSMTLGGLVKHVALVEADWLAVKLAGQEYGAPCDAVDFDADPNWEWRTGALDSPDEIYAVWRGAVERSRELVAEVIKERGLDGPASFTWPDGRTPSVGAMLLDMMNVPSMPSTGSRCWTCQSVTSWPLVRTRSATATSYSAGFNANVGQRSMPSSKVTDIRSS
jgi:hypothetical protein